VNKTEIDKVLTDKCLVYLLFADMKAISDVDIKKYTKATFSLVQLLDILKVEAKSIKKILDSLQTECEKRDLIIPEMDA
jgi:chromosome segregation and condensation protein ScpB